MFQYAIQLKHPLNLHIRLATHNPTRDGFVDVGGLLQRILDASPSLHLGTGQRTHRAYSTSRRQNKGSHTYRLRRCSPEPLPELDVVTVGIADRRSGVRLADSWAP